LSVTEQKFGLYDAAFEKSSCGVGFITRKDGVQTHDVLKRGHEALCAVPHRGGMSAEGVGDGAGVSLDLSLSFFRKLTDNDSLQAGRFGVGKPSRLRPVLQLGHATHDPGRFGRGKRTGVGTQTAVAAPQGLARVVAFEVAGGEERGGVQGDVLAQLVARFDLRARP